MENSILIKVREIKSLWKNPHSFVESESVSLWTNTSKFKKFLKQLYFLSVLTEISKQKII